jgi:hypothetical protein
MNKLDKEMSNFSGYIQRMLRIPPTQSEQLATTIAGEISSLSTEAKQRIQDTSVIPLGARLEELFAFQDFMDRIHSNPHPQPSEIRAQVIYQNYICFVYLNEACFKVIKTEVPDGSVTKKCCKFLLDERVRAFRNAIAHSNWRYLPDFSGLEYWSRKEHTSNAPMDRYEVAQGELSFWQALARCVAYSSFLKLNTPQP